MLTAEKCRRRAVECKRVALQTEDLLVRTALLRIAREWEGLAEHLSRTRTA
jgi:hypothetical protein